MKRADYFIVPFVMDFTISGSGLLANLLAQDLHANAMQLGMIGASWGLPYAVLCFFAGRAAGKFDRRFILIASTLLFTIYAAVCAFAASPLHLICVGPIGGIASALFWPAYETLLHDDDPAETNKRLAVFNTGWTFGIMSGAAIGGKAYAVLGGHIVFLLLSVIVFCDALYIVWSTRHGISQYKPVQPEALDDGTYALSMERRVGYMRMAWVANFTLWFGGATANTIFPKLARSIHMTDGLIGIITATVWIGQLIIFYKLARDRRWHYRYAPMFLMQIVGMAGMFFMATGNVALVFVAAFMMLGAARGLSYTASLFYGLDTNGPGAANTGLHESILGAASVVAPLISGYAADSISLRSPFIIAGLVALAGLLVQGLLWKRLTPYRVVSI